MKKEVRYKACRKCDKVEATEIMVESSPEDFYCKPCYERISTEALTIAVGFAALLIIIVLLSSTLQG